MAVATQTTETTLARCTPGDFAELGPIKHLSMTGVARSSTLADVEVEVYPWRGQHPIAVLFVSGPKPRVLVRTYGNILIEHLAPLAGMADMVAGTARGILRDKRRELIGDDEHGA